MNRALNVCSSDQNSYAAIESLANRWELRHDHVFLQFSMHNELALIGPVARFLCRKASSLGLCTPQRERQAIVAIQEALLNALYHGNLELSTAELCRARQKLLIGYPIVSILERQQKFPFTQRLIHVSASISHTEARFVIRDEGPGFDYIVCTPLVIEDGATCRPSGRGLNRMFSFMDDVRFNANGNQVTLTLSRSTPPRLSLRCAA